MKEPGGLRSKLTFRNMSMAKKLLLIFLIIIILPLAIISYITYSSYSRSIKDNTELYSTNMINQMIERVDDYLKDMERISSIPAYVDDIKLNLVRSNQYHELSTQLSGGGSTVAVPTDFNLQLSIQRGIEDNISLINNIKRGANSVYIFDKYGNGYYSTREGGMRLDIKESYLRWNERVQHSHGEAILFSTEEYQSNLKSTRYAFTIVRKVLDNSLSPIGLIAVDANISVIEDQMKELEEVTHGQSLIIDESGRVVYDSQKAMLASNMADHDIVKQAIGDTGSFYDTVDGKRQLYIYSTSPHTKWKVIISIPVKQLTQETDRTRNAMLIATFSIVAVALAFSIIAVFALTNPLKKLIQLMRQVQAGDLSVQFNVQHRDEVGQLGNQFNRMINRIKHLIENIYEIETQKKEAELNALQSQINPHFMYNTLETIRMTAELNDDPDAADMISILGKLLRYSISHIQDNVVLKQELDHVNNYVKLLNYRYPNRFDLEVDVPAELMSYPMIRLVFQPIVENAVYHGLDDSKPKMKIRIHGEQTGKLVRFEINDDGCGMDDDRLQKLNDSIHSSVKVKKRSDGGIGLRNVHERIVLQHGTAYGINVNSQLGEGTQVIILMPPFLDSELGQLNSGKSQRGDEG